MRFLPSLFLFSLLLFPLQAKVHVNQEGDFQFWSDTNFIKKINEDMTLFLQYDARFGGNVTELYHTHFHVSFFFRVSRWFVIAPGYRQIATQDFALRKWTSIYDPLCDLILNGKYKDWDVSDRHRLQYLITGGHQRWLYRNRLLLNSPWQLSCFKFQPLLFNEVFFMEGAGFSQNRFAAGGSIPLYGNTKAILLYMMRSVKYPTEWRNFNTLWLTIDFNF